MTVKATITAAFPEAHRIHQFLERDYGGSGVAISLDERAGGTWSVEVYFEDRDGEAVAADVRERLGTDAFGAPLAVEDLPEADWVAAGLSSLNAVAAGRFLVHGSHQRDRIRSRRFAIEIDAGQAFGTGHHATTAGCLAVIDRMARGRRFTRLLDLGVGSGVLAIALAKMLRRPVLASDVDPVAVRVARKNARLNGVGTLVDCVVAEGVGHPAIRRRAPYDLVVANILAEPLACLAPRLAPLVANGGILVLSGLLRHQRERVVAAYRSRDLALIEARYFAGWAVLVLQRRRRRPRRMR